VGIGGGLKGNLPSQEEAAVVAIDCKKSGSSDIAKKKKTKVGREKHEEGKIKEWREEAENRKKINMS
jgi:hypothetical protein